MNVAWIFPHEERCGIALYSRRYVEALRRHTSITCLDPATYTVDATRFAALVNHCDLVHIQYEPSYYAHAERDFFAALCRTITIPIVVSLHEIYRSHPDVYPRDAIRGHGPVAVLQRIIYDCRHPLQTAYRRHIARSFYADRVFVHHDFQREILSEQGCPACIIDVLPHPVIIDPDAASVPDISPDRPLRLAASGFINPHFDYDLLFAMLDLLPLPWTFTWIGGLRRDEDAPLMQRILQRIQASGWSDRFFVTGWVDDAELFSRLRNVDIVCAFFSTRSSSGSIAAALGALRPVVATPIPLTEELAREGVVLVAPADAMAIAAQIARLSNDRARLTSLMSTLTEYRNQNSYSDLSGRLIERYRELCAVLPRRRRQP